MNARNKKLNAITATIVCAAAVLIVVALVNIVSISGEYKENEVIYSSLAQYAAIPEGFGLSDETVGGVNEQGGYENTIVGHLSGDARLAGAPGDVGGLVTTGAYREGTADEGAQEPYARESNASASDAPPHAKASFIDFDALKEINGDITAWLYIPGTDINYPVVHGEDNDYYLGHSADMEENKAGAIFIDMLNAPEFADKNTVIYGHNMKNGSMFAGLHEFEEEEYYTGHPYLYIFTDDGDAHKYGIISAYEIEAGGDAAYTISFEDDEAFIDYVDQAILKAPVQPEEPFVPDAESKIVTLSTCVTGEHDQRYVLVAAEVQ